MPLIVPVVLPDPVHQHDLTACGGGDTRDDIVITTAPPAAPVVNPDPPGRQ